LKRPWLLPLVPLYASASALRWTALKPKRLSWPVVSVGNLSTGGTGKTPFTIALAQLLVREGTHVDVLSRGYGRQSRQSSEVARVDPNGSARLFGDEPLLIGRSTGVPVYVASQRWQAGKLAERESATETGVHLLDDGFQHRQLFRQIDVVLLNSEDLRDSLLPAGNLRESPAALRRASVLAVPAEDEACMAQIQALGLDQPIWRFHRKMQLAKIPVHLAAGRFTAFCGIARPAQFFRGLAEQQIQIAAHRVFPDHHPYSSADLETLRKLALSSGSAALITTAKDMLRMGSLASDPTLQIPIFSVDLEVTLENEAGIAAWLRTRLAFPAS
jgi:tetraacyldisaccharide 4'-kinase